MVRVSASEDTVLTLLRKLIICSVTSVLTLERSHTLVRNVGGAFLSLQIAIDTSVINILQTNTHWKEALLM